MTDKKRMHTQEELPELYCRHYTYLNIIYSDETEKIPWYRLERHLLEEA